MNNEIKTILFVCTGNTCRSAMAEAVFNKLAGESGLKISASSAGLFADAGQPASENAVIACAEIAVDLKRHRARQITNEIIAANDLIIPISDSHRKVLSANYKIANEKIFDSEMNISDPYMGNLEVYKHCLSEIMILCEKVMAYLNKCV